MPKLRGIGRGSTLDSFFVRSDGFLKFDFASENNTISPMKEGYADARYGNPEKVRPHFRKIPHHLTERIMLRFLIL